MNVSDEVATIGKGGIMLKQVKGQKGFTLIELMIVGDYRYLGGHRHSELLCATKPSRASRKPRRTWARSSWLRRPTSAKTRAMAASEIGYALAGTTNRYTYRSPAILGNGASSKHRGRRSDSQRRAGRLHRSE